MEIKLRTVELKVETTVKTCSSRCFQCGSEGQKLALSDGPGTDFSCSNCHAMWGEHPQELIWPTKRTALCPYFVTGEAVKELEKELAHVL